MIEAVAITALIVGGGLVLSWWILQRIDHLDCRRAELVISVLDVVRKEWREALPVILAELDFSFSPTLTIEIKQGVSTGVDIVSQTLETLPLIIQTYISKDSADFAREDLVKRAFVFRDGGKKEWEDVLEMLKESVDHAW